MIKKKVFCSVLFLHIFIFCSGQKNLPVSKNFSQAIENRTRTTEGKPGERYWQNKADYDIRVEILPHEKKLIGTELISYKNNSPDTLYQIVFHVFQNLYKIGAMRDAPVHTDDVHSGVEIESLKIKNKAVDDLKTEGTILVVRLEEPVIPSGKVMIEISWNFSIPTKSDIRMGGKDETSFFLGQWYPKIAVYDDIKGWDMDAHTGGQEFYYDLGSYKYSVKVPKGYLVWGSGMLENARDVLTENIYVKFIKAKTGKEIISIVGPDDYKSGKDITKGNIWEFVAESSSDVAFGISNHFFWDGTSLTGISDNNIFIEAVYPSDALDFVEVAQLARRTIHHLSTELPGYPFPFPTITVFNGTNGTSGMEYPMIVNNPSAVNRGRTVDVTAHEIAHNYFPFYVLTNETESAWMDEALASMITYKYQLETDSSLNRLTRYVKNMSDYANTNWNIASNTKSTMLKGEISFFNFYMKPSVALYILKDLLGEDLFKKCIISYINTWKEKHPTALDFFYLINKTANKDLNWFWESWFYGNGYPDLAIGFVEEKDNTYWVAIHKIGDLPVPVSLAVTYDDMTIQNFYYTAAIWEDKDSITIPIDTNKRIKKLKLGNDYIPDTNSKDNIKAIR